MNLFPHKAAPSLAWLLLAIGCVSSEAAAPVPAAPQPAPTAVQPAAVRDEVKKFIVVIEGRNLILRSGGKPARFGFSATRDVEARSAKEAELRAMQSVREDEELNRALLNPPTDPPRIDVTQSVEVQSFETYRRPRQHYIFYVDRDSP